MKLDLSSTDLWVKGRARSRLLNAGLFPGIRRVCKAFRKSRRRFHRWYAVYGKVYLDLYLRKKPPIVVYQMGKVASTSVSRSFPVDRYERVCQVHFLSREGIRLSRQEHRLINLPIPTHLKLGALLRKHVVERNVPAKYITMVREPIGRNISGFFTSFERFTGVPFSEARFSIDELIRIFLNRFPHNLGLDWFDREFCTMLKIDVYEKPFPYDRGWDRLSNGLADVLILKVEAQDEVKEEAIAQFLEIDSFRLQRMNEGAGKDYAECYAQFKEVIRLPPDLLEFYLESKYARHFYSEADRRNLRKRWSRL